MKLERIKSILLVLLVISSIVLTVNKWFDEKLWPEGYNFFSDVKNGFASKASKEVPFNPNEEVLRPAKIIINNSGNHILYTKSSDEYAALFGEIKKVLTASVSVDEEIEVSSKEWNNRLKSKSCYFSYPVTYDYGFLFSQLTNKYSNRDLYCKEFLISYDSRLSSSLDLYFKDAKTEKISQKRISFDGKTIKSQIEKISSSNENNFYSFELNFDTQKADSVDQPVIIDSDVLINVSQKNLPNIVETNVFADIANNEELHSAVLSVFGFNTSSIRRYVESDNSIVFVENYGTAKLKTNALLDFKAVNNSMGIELEGNNSYESINSCITFVNSVTSSLFSGNEMTYEISSDISDIKSRTYTLEFDYYLKDNMIAVSGDDYGMDHAIVVEVVSGKIVSYKQICKDFSSSSEMLTCASAIEAIDALYAGNQSGEAITDIFTAYKFDVAKNKWSPCWYIERSDGLISEIPLSSGGDGA